MIFLHWWYTEKFSWLNQIFTDWRARNQLRRTTTVSGNAWKGSRLGAVSTENVIWWSGADKPTFLCTHPLTWAKPAATTLNLPEAAAAGRWRRFSGQTDGETDTWAAAPADLSQTSGAAQHTYFKQHFMNSLETSLRKQGKGSNMWSETNWRRRRKTKRYKFWFGCGGRALEGDEWKVCESLDWSGADQHSLCCLKR